VNLVATERSAELSHALVDALDNGELIVNLRAEADPELLRRAMIDTLNSQEKALGGATLRVERVECFRPAMPTPTHRLSAVTLEEA
jgi:hypothetical protein